MSVPFGIPHKQLFDSIISHISNMFVDQKCQPTIQSLYWWFIWPLKCSCLLCCVLLKHAHHHKILDNRSLETNLKLHITIISVVIADGRLLIVWCSYTKLLSVPEFVGVCLFSVSFLALEWSTFGFVVVVIT